VSAWAATVPIIQHIRTRAEAQQQAIGNLLPKRLWKTGLCSIHTTNPGHLEAFPDIAYRIHTLSAYPPGQLTKQDIRVDRFGDMCVHTGRKASCYIVREGIG
jgi:hypothetical protein